MAEENLFKRRRFDSEQSCSTRPGRHFDTPPIEPINVDMGGTLFRVSKTTLTDNSSYFESLLSDRWQCEEKSGSDGESSPSIFVDQDPKAFEILLNYMRSGMVYLPPDDQYLGKKTLMLAEYLGTHGFLITVKAITMKNISRRDDYLSDEVSEAAQFDVRFGSVRMAVNKGILPLCFFPPKDDLKIISGGGPDRIFHASKSVLTEKSGYFSRLLTANPEDYWKEEYISGENPDVMEVALQMLSSPNSAFTTMTEKFHSVSGQNVKFRHFYVQAILTWLDKLQLSVDFRDNCVQTITHTFNA
mmetsp:Transcript_33642/g.57192  ORF Transcript_33642/g.57192 Transcript_33642/m.57192 type:complete len:301 (+) Transcript_33642:53-955(+)|eukprot:CAMPEP_0183713716 /NCGR_PEP_ID=MMETSP0737-20130205/8482_1 /TAXON_ID=385413 /ORGANISM="Thalassiosira miniscula, Strain CCMP1093" /LENGTH=300 /DNA_ID=CAMNT_0025942541 /DNA_START=93 /DNA_END=995 /DNA_ORIENTATION=-